MNFEASYEQISSKFETMLRNVRGTYEPKTPVQFKRRESKESAMGKENMGIGSLTKEQPGNTLGKLCIRENNEGNGIDRGNLKENHGFKDDFQKENEKKNWKKSFGGSQEELGHRYNAEREGKKELLGLRSPYKEGNEGEDAIKSKELENQMKAANNRGGDWRKESQGSKMRNYQTNSNGFEPNGETLLDRLAIFSQKALENQRISEDFQETEGNSYETNELVEISEEIKAMNAELKKMQGLKSLISKQEKNSQMPLHPSTLRTLNKQKEASLSPPICQRPQRNQRGIPPQFGTSNQKPTQIHHFEADFAETFSKKEEFLPKSSETAEKFYTLSDSLNEETKMSRLEATNPEIGSNIEGIKEEISDLKQKCNLLKEVYAKMEQEIQWKKEKQLEELAETKRKQEEKSQKEESEKRQREKEQIRIQEENKMLKEANRELAKELNEFRSATQELKNQLSKAQEMIMEDQVSLKGKEEKIKALEEFIFQNTKITKINYN